MILHSLPNMVVRFSCFLAFFLLTIWFETIWLLCWDMRWWAREWNNTTLHLGLKPTQWWSNVACWSCLISLKLCFLSMVGVCLSTVGSQSVLINMVSTSLLPFPPCFASSYGFCTLHLLPLLLFVSLQKQRLNYKHPSFTTQLPPPTHSDNLSLQRKWALDVLLENTL
jgi:hypothetical protein